MATAQYRVSSNEVIKISIPNQIFIEDTFWGVLTDPILTDGNQVRDVSGPDVGPLRVLGFAKIAVPGTNTIRNATQVEIDSFQAFEDADDNIKDRDRAGELGTLHPRWRKLVKAILKAAVRENNIMANRYNELRAEMLAASSLNNLQTRILNNTQNVPTRTNEQAYDAISDDVNEND